MLDKATGDARARGRAGFGLDLCSHRLLRPPVPRVGWGVSMERRIHALHRFTVGWTAYFALADTPSPLAELDEWLRRRLRQVKWNPWKRYRTRRRELRALGIPERAAREWAGSRKGYWQIAGSGPTWASRAPAIPTAFSGMRCKPPDADPYVRWCRRGRGKPGPHLIWEGTPTAAWNGVCVPLPFE